MWYFLTVGLPKTAVPLLQKLLPAEIAAHQTQNPSITTMLPNRYVAYHSTSRGCSCDLFSLVPGEQAKEHREKKRVQKYRKKGWSESKIARAISQAQETGNRNDW